MMAPTPGYVRLGREGKVGETWMMPVVRVFVDHSESPTAEIMEIGEDTRMLSRADINRAVGRPPMYAGKRRQMDGAARLWSAMVMVGVMMMAGSVGSLGVIALYALAGF